MAITTAGKMAHKTEDHLREWEHHRRGGVAHMKRNVSENNILRALQVEEKCAVGGDKPWKPSLNSCHCLLFDGDF